MKRRQYLLLLVLTVIAGLVGGAVSNHLMVKTADAQNLTAHGNITSLKAFRLVDENEKLRAVLELSDGEPSLKFYDEDGNDIINLEIDSLKNSSGLALNGINGETRAALYVLPDSSNLLIGDENGILRAGLGVGADEKYSLELFDKDGGISARFDDDGIWTASGTGQEAALTPDSKMMSIWGMIKKADQ